MNKQPTFGYRATLVKTLLMSVCVILSVGALSACNSGDDQGIVSTESFGQLSIQYPLDETLFPPDIVAPKFIWEDKTQGVSKWQVVIRFQDSNSEELSFTSQEANWQPTEQAWLDHQEADLQAVKLRLFVSGLNNRMAKYFL